MSSSDHAAADPTTAPSSPCQVSFVRNRDAHDALHVEADGALPLHVDHDLVEYGLRASGLAQVGSTHRESHRAIHSLSLVAVDRVNDLLRSGVRLREHMALAVQHAQRRDAAVAVDAAEEVRRVRLYFTQRIVLLRSKLVEQTVDQLEHAQSCAAAESSATDEAWASRPEGRQQRSERARQPLSGCTRPAWLQRRCERADREAGESTQRALERARGRRFARRAACPRGQYARVGCGPGKPPAAAPRSADAFATFVHVRRTRTELYESAILRCDCVSTPTPAVRPFA